MRPTKEIDLDVLTRAREPAGASEPSGGLRPPRRWLRFALPLALVAAFLAVLATSLGDVLGGAVEVTLIRPEPVVGEHAVRAAAGTVVAQAAGWVEPDPFPIRATALAPGVVQELLVQESDVVEQGDVLARLVDEDARLAHARAAAILAGVEARERRARAELEAARAAYDAPTGLTEAVAVGRASLEGRSAEAEHRARAVAKGRALLSIAEDELIVQRELSAAGAAGPRQVEIAAARVEEARADLAILEALSGLAAADAAVAEAELARAERDLELRIEDTLRVASAEASLDGVRAELEEARAMRDEAALRLERTSVRAPADGVVLERLATVGTQLEGPESAVVTLYDPRSVRIRVDVPQQDLAELFVGQEVRIESDARQGRPYRGEVTRVVRRADIQKVTLQAHVRVLDGDELLRPEMLMQVRFLAASAERASEGGPSAMDASRVSIPARLLLAGDRVWIVDGETGRAALRDVRLERRDAERAIVAAGLDLSDKLIDRGREDLEPGDRLKVEEAAP